MTLSEELQLLHSNPNEQMRKIAQKFDEFTGGTVDDPQGVAVANLAASTDITAVPGSFADEAAVQTYLAAAVPIIETRLDNLEAKVNALLTSLRNAGIIAA